MNGGAAVEELQKIFKHKSLNDAYISANGTPRARFPTADSSRFIKDILRTNQVKAAQSQDSISRPVVAPPDITLSPDCAKKYTSKVVSVKKRFIPAAQKVVDRSLLQGVVCNDVLSAVQGLARVVVAICSQRRASAVSATLSPGCVSARPKSWSMSPTPQLMEEVGRPRGASATPSLTPGKSKSHDALDADDVTILVSPPSRDRKKASRDSMSSVSSVGSGGKLESLRRCSIANLDPLKTELSSCGCTELTKGQFEKVVSTVRSLCEAVAADMEIELLEEDGESQLDVIQEVFTKRRIDLIHKVESFFLNGETQGTLATVKRTGVTRRSKSCVLKPQEPNMRRTLSDAKRYFTKSRSSTESARNCTSVSSQETVRDARDSVISSSSTNSSNSSYDEEGLARNLPRYQKKKIRAALVQTQIPVGVSMKRRTSSTITQDEAILLGVTMPSIGNRRSVIGEESEYSDEENRQSATWRDSGIDTISSTYTSINASISDDEDFNKIQRPLSPVAALSPDFDLTPGEFLCIEVSGELGGHFSKGKKTLGQSPSNMGRYFRIHVKTNIEKLQLQSYVIYKKFRDVIALYEDIENICPDGIAQIEKPDRSIFSKKQNRIQVERLLLSVARNNKLRSLEPVINFLKPDCLLTEESSHVAPKTPKCSTPPSGTTANDEEHPEEPREHPNSAIQEVRIAEFFTPNTSSGPPGTEHAPQVVHSQNGTSSGESETLVQKTLKFLNQKSSADTDKMTDDEKYNPFIQKDDEGNPLLLMIFSYEKDGYTIEGGSLEQLVQQLYCGTCPDADYIQTFLLGYKLFMQPEELMDMLLRKFVDSENYEEEQGDMVKLRLSNIVTQWLERVWVDFHYSDVMIEKVDKFVLLVSSGHPRFLPVAMKLENTMQKKKREWEESLRDEDRHPGSLPGSGNNSPTESPVPIRRSNSDTKNNDAKAKKRKPINLSEVTPSQIARHLHCVDFELMAKVELHEYFTYFCRKKDPKYHLLTQHLDNWISQWNKVSAWVTSEILRDETPRGRASKIERLIDVAKHLKQLFSFNTLYAFVTGFNHSAVSRLKKTWDCVKSSSQTSLHDLEELMSNLENFTQYRRHLNKVPRTVCSIPLLSLILRDIEFLNVNSPKLKNGLWNFGKLRLLKNKISDMERYKLIKPQNHIITDDDILNFCRILPTIPASSFYDVSLEREPKELPRPARPVSVSSLSSVATSSSS